MTRPARLSVHASGPLACFTRPEFGVERVSYPIITPTAAVGLLSAVFWKPEFRWVIDEVWVCNPIRWHGFTTNEVTEVASTRKLGIDPVSTRTQRHSMCLADVAYVIHAHIDLKPDAGAPVAKWQDQFRRRVARGAQFSQPYLGLQQFHADVRPFNPDTDRPDDTVVMPVGPMPLDLRFTGKSKAKGDFEPDGGIDPEWFPAMITEGVMPVPTIGSRP